MDDLISRQTAIDVLDRNHILGQGLLNDTLDHIADAIMALPSAQPEIIRCKDCEWWEKQKDSLQGRCELMQMYPTGAWYCGNAQRRETDG